MFYVRESWHDVCGQVADKHKVKLSAYHATKYPHTESHKSQKQLSPLYK